MIILDSNVVSALMRLDPETAVAIWLNRQAIDDLFLTPVTIFEIHFGLERMPPGKAKRNTEMRFTQVLTNIVSGRSLNLDQQVSETAARLHVMRGKHTAKLDAPDSKIAGIALQSGATIAPRNTQVFANLGVDLVNPWTA
jgi:toxin FitB